MLTFWSFSITSFRFSSITTRYCELYYWFPCEFWILVFKWLGFVMSTYLYGAFVCFYHVMYAFQSDCGCGFESRCSHLNFWYCACFEQEFLDSQATIECGFTLKRVRGMIKTNNLFHICSTVFFIYDSLKGHRCM